VNKSIENNWAGVKVAENMDTGEKKEQYRQGDVLIELVAQIPDIAQRMEGCQQVILAHGEMTGHSHVLEAEEPFKRWNLSQPPYYFREEILYALSKGGVVNHPEHAPIVLPPGNYRVTRQREYSPKGARRVGD
jgi:hypothetical protein